MHISTVLLGLSEILIVELDCLVCFTAQYLVYLSYADMIEKFTRREKALALPINLLVNSMVFGHPNQFSFIVILGDQLLSLVQFKYLLLLLMYGICFQLHGRTVQNRMAI